MRDLIQKFVDKGLLEFSYVHHLVWEYASELLRGMDSMSAKAIGGGSLGGSGGVVPTRPMDAPAGGASGDVTMTGTGDGVGKKTRMDDLVNQLIDFGPKLMSTKPGAKAMTVVVTHANVKDRKRIMKTLKGHTVESLLHDSAYLVILRLVDVTDDTITVQKSLLDEIKSPQPDIKYTATGEVIGTPLPPLVSLAHHRHGHKLLLRLLAPEHRLIISSRRHRHTQTLTPPSHPPPHPPSFSLTLSIWNPITNVIPTLSPLLPPSPHPSPFPHPSFPIPFH